VLVFKAARNKSAFGGASCKILPLLLSVRFLAVSEANKKTLFNLGLVDELSGFLEMWVEDGDDSLGVQLECLELALSLLITMLR